MRLSDGQRATLVRFLTNADTIILGGLILGPFLGPPPFRWKLFAVGAMLYTAILWAALRLSLTEKEFSG